VAEKSKSFGEPASPGHASINVFRIIRRANKKYFIFRLQLVNLGQEPFHNLDVVLRDISAACREKPIHFVQKEDRRRVFFRPRKYPTMRFTESPTPLPMNVCGTDRIKTSLRPAIRRAN
jgi:hypothetical protein